MIRIDAVSKRHGRQILFLEASAVVNRGEKVALVGPNGSGKTTIFRLLTGEEEPDDGQVAVDRGVSIGYFSQDAAEMKGQSVVEAILDGAGPVSEAARTLHALEHALADPARAGELEKLVERYGEAQARFEELGGYGLDARAREVLAGLGFEPAQMDGDVAALSGGWRMRVALARILVMQPDALLLDEPTNHLDLESILWLESWLRAFEGAVVMTSHDPELLNRLVTKVIEIDGGELTSYSGDYDFYERQRALGEREQAAQYSRQQAMLAKEEAFIARFKARASHAAQVQSRVKKLEKIERVEPPKRRQLVEFEFRPAPRSGDDVLKLAGVHKTYGERRVFAGLDLGVRRGERWCVMGANGAGKSTLLKIAAGALAPDAGAAALGAAVKLGYFAQHSMELLDGDASVYETLEAAFPEASVGTLRTLAGCFGFSGDEVEKRCRLLSGGERVRLVLARMLYDPPNFLVLDEPSNHLDLATKEMLIRALAGYEGTLLLVSHDRRFLTALTNRVLELTPEGPHVYGGGYAEYVVASGHEAPGMRGPDVSETRPPRPRAVLLGVQLSGVSDGDFAASLAELSRLAKTLGLEVVGRVTQRRGRLAPGAVVGGGKLQELARWTGGTGIVPVGPPTARRRGAAPREDEDARAEGDAATEASDAGDADLEVAGGPATPEPAALAGVVLVDCDLSPSQARNLERATGAEVLDRTAVILAIFQRHARSREARLQVEVARLRYIAPRLRETGLGRDRQTGGIGGRGAGESTSELDRRKVRDRIAELRAELAAIEREAGTRRSRRSDQPTVALVGYTNAGKSSWMRALTGSGVLVEDKLFATLDTTVRALRPETVPRILVSDTVGFIKKLPHDLVASFRSTLEEARDCDLLVHVVDASDPSFPAQIEVTREVLAEIGATESPRLVALNKVDRLDAAERARLAAEWPEALLVSVREPTDVAALRERLVGFFERGAVEAELVVPWSKQRVVAEAHERARVLEARSEADGTHLRVRARPDVLARLRAELEGA